MILLFHSLVGFFLIVSEATWLHELSLGGIIPSLMIPYLVCVGTFQGRDKGLWCGLITGLVHDLIFSRTLGLFALMYMLCGYVSGVLTTNLDRTRLMIPLALSGLMTLVMGLLQALLFQWIPGTMGVGESILRVLVPELIYTLLTSVLVYVLYYAGFRLYRRLKFWIRQRRIAQ